MARPVKKFNLAARFRLLVNLHDKPVLALDERMLGQIFFKGDDIVDFHFVKAVIF